MCTAALEEIKRAKLVAIIRSQSSEGLENTVRSLYQGGIRAVEITLNTPGAFTGIERMKQKFPELLIGAGTVLDSESARLAIASGASFLLTPTLKKETIETARYYQVPIIPGVMTPTEVLTAYEYGAKMVKIFPIRPLGPKYLTDLKGPLPFVETMAVGGVSLENANVFLKAGAHCLGIGSSLVDDKLVQHGDFTEIERRAARFVEIVHEVQSPN
ncbi:bifunctional 4-hydroxy-2-oxoglutarate aldolase/2-dehydro-3-deoxy-phosphogluconate aldolase [Neobacillus sp. MM2021_6]|uniref:bifunctional 4-hydroxy-2-oxoglutarate aldolase/2-dehydro-3-deoxy-phosphogluconate aldolase n=1 Tax=Bacillaceae TaxID=186817 RepID=UPI00140AAF17|nr:MULTISPECIES: bifunctional 4-hydroxy-2-oxoglutarate aldolase/2-dehydro-3-deoxy-phosphogluconate aldolase [Bacillaceae]MBO0958775.1 bifunctional 4-hydroxy-2-oxoglutarate aldolase/2-dehydro-3-deoxy-phosphogluconate aldolase [Neobacillus sp. MM2021_6]NHC20002.1 bifunctional 4-hydroxy-2-oxoglutarate aldolase/2-dehydro-3-deoxy-phosphogluconate aldolase [Bacillus sp. MM2020_4]